MTTQTQTQTQPPPNVVAVEETGLETRTELSHDLQSTPEAARAVAEIRGAILMARHFPRDEDKAIVRINKTCRRFAFAEAAFYAFPRGGTTVQGPSVNLARELGRLWGNVRWGKRVLRDDGESILLEAWAWDVELNSFVSDQDTFKNLVQRKNPKTRRTEWVVPDERDKRELINRRGAICTRNCLLQVLPRDVVDQAFDLCKDRVRKGAKDDYEGVVRNLLTNFSALGIEKEHLEGWLARKRGAEAAPIRSMSEDEVVELRGIYTSLKEGNSNAAEYFTFGFKAPREKGTLKTENMKPGDPKSNKGFDQAPKPVDDASRRKRIREIADELTDDKHGAAQAVNEWTKGKPLDDLSGPDLEKIVVIAQGFIEKRRATEPAGAAQ